MDTGIGIRFSHFADHLSWYVYFKPNSTNMGETY